MDTIRVLSGYWENLIRPQNALQVWEVVSNIVDVHKVWWRMLDSAQSRDAILSDRKEIGYSN